MTARENLDYFSDGDMMYCENCKHAEVLGELGGVKLLRCTNAGSSDNEHVFTDYHFACDPDLYDGPRQTEEEDDDE